MRRERAKKQQVFDAVFKALEAAFPEQSIRVDDGKELEVRFDYAVGGPDYVRITFHNRY